MRTLFIVNPRSSNGRTGRRWRKLLPVVRKHFGDSFEYTNTEYAFHAASLARRGIDEGYTNIISVGGDGTINEVLNGFFRNGKLINGNVALGILPIGTGADFARYLALPATDEERIKRLKEPKLSKIDVGKAEYRSLNGDMTTRYFINILDFGIGGAVVERVNRTTKLFGGKMSFLWSIFLTLPSYKNKHITYRLDDGVWQEKVLNNFIVANGAYFGGGLHPAPHARIDDGFFDIVLFGDVTLFEALRNLPHLRKGKHLAHPKIFSTRAAAIEARSGETIYIDIDGECAGTLPVKVTILKKVLPFSC